MTIGTKPDTMTEQTATTAATAAEFSIVVPTFNERSNVAELVGRVSKALAGIDWEIIFVDDDSPDGTADEVRELGRTDPRVRCIQRIGRRGLSSACVEGFLASSAPVLAVIDGDLQHDERKLAPMYRQLVAGNLDVVVGSRYLPESDLGGWEEKRVRISRFSTQLARKVLGVELSDPMSGFFVLRREFLDEVVHGLSANGFKILLDLFATAGRRVRFEEFPYRFRQRFSGESKLDTRAILDFVELLIQKKFGWLLPARLLYFCLVGGTGLAVHLAVFVTAFHLSGLGFGISQTLATAVAMTGNFTLNNLITYRDRRLSGWAWLRGLLLFYAACSIGALANVGIASYLFSQTLLWFPSVLAGVLMGTIWNYVTTYFYIWKPGR